MDKFFMNKKYIFIFSVVVILIAVVCGIWFATGSSRDEELRTSAPLNADDAVRVQKAEQNIVALKESLAQDPQNPEIKRSLARALVLVGNAQEAQRYITEAITQKNDNPQYYVDLGNIYFVQNDIMKAEEQFSKAIRIFNQKISPPQSESLGNPLGEEITSGTGQINQEKKLTEAVPVVAYTRLADIYLRQNKPTETISLLKEGITLSPQYPDFYMMLSQAYQRLHDIENETKYQKVFEELTSSFKRS